MNLLTQLPMDCVRSIYGHLALIDRIMFTRTSKLLHTLSDNNTTTSITSALRQSLADAVGDELAKELMNLVNKTHTERHNSGVVSIYGSILHDALYSNPSKHVSNINLLCSLPPLPMPRESTGENIISMTHMTLFRGRCVCITDDTIHIKQTTTPCPGEIRMLQYTVPNSTTRIIVMGVRCRATEFIRDMDYEYTRMYWNGKLMALSPESIIRRHTQQRCCRYDKAFSIISSVLEPRRHITNVSDQVADRRLSQLVRGFGGVTQCVVTGSVDKVNSAYSGSI